MVWQHVISWRWTGDKPLHESIMILLNAVWCRYNSQFSSKSIQKTLHSSPIGARYGVSFVGKNPALYSASVTAVVSSQRTQDAKITSLWHQNDVAFWRHNDVIITYCVRWDVILDPTIKASCNVDRSHHETHIYKTNMFIELTSDTLGLPTNYQYQAVDGGFCG